MAAQGPAAVTVQAVASAAGLSNGALYHNFSSRSELMGRAWMRAGNRFLALQREAVGTASGVEAVVAAAEAPAAFAARHPESARLVLTVRREEILGPELSDGLTGELLGLDTLLVGVMIGARRAAGDAATPPRSTPSRPASSICRPRSCSAATGCIDPTAREQLGAAVRAVLETGPAPRKENTDDTDPGTGGRYRRPHPGRRREPLHPDFLDTVHCTAGHGARRRGDGSRSPPRPASSTPTVWIWTGWPPTARRPSGTSDRCRACWHAYSPCRSRPPPPSSGTPSGGAMLAYRPRLPGHAHRPRGYFCFPEGRYPDPLSRPAWPR